MQEGQESQSHAIKEGADDTTAALNSQQAAKHAGDPLQKAILPGVQSMPAAVISRPADAFEAALTEALAKQSLKEEMSSAYGSGAVSQDRQGEQRAATYTPPNTPALGTSPSVVEGKKTGAQQARAVPELASPAVPQEVHAKLEAEPIATRAQAEDKSSGYVTDVEDEAAGGPLGDLQEHVSRHVTLDIIQEVAVTSSDVKSPPSDQHRSQASVGGVQEPKEAPKLEAGQQLQTSGALHTQELAPRRVDVAAGGDTQQVARRHVKKGKGGQEEGIPGPETPAHGDAAARARQEPAGRPSEETVQQDSMQQATEQDAPVLKSIPVTGPVPEDVPDSSSAVHAGMQDKEEASTSSQAAASRHDNRGEHFLSGNFQVAKK